MNDIGFIGTYWGVLKEDIDVCAFKIWALINHLAMHNEYLKTWYETTKPKKSETVMPIPIESEAFKKFLAGKRNYNDDGTLNEDLGYTLFLKSSPNFSKSNVLSITCGCFNNLISNSVTLSIKYETDNQIANQENLIAIYNSIVTIWRPDKCMIKYNDSVLFMQSPTHEQ
jgi:hypothetical protein